MARNVVWIPGVLGCSLSVFRGGGPVKSPIWVDGAGLLLGGIVSLQLGPDGQSPGPLADANVVSVDGIYAPAYGALPAFLETAGYRVLRLAFDWRKDVVSEAARLWPSVAAFAGGQPFAIVAHSFGGLLARAIYGQALAAGAGGQLAALVTIGCPHFGSLEAVRLFFRLPILYQALALLCDGGARGLQNAGPDWLDATLATFPCWYELLPWQLAGPLFNAHPDQAASLYQLATYAGGNTHISAGLLQAAPIVQGELAGWLPAGKTTSIASVGWLTPEFLNPGQALNTDAGYTYTQQGDGLVTVAEASPPGATVIQTAAPHFLQCFDPGVLGLLPFLLGT